MDKLDLLRERSLFKIQNTPQKTYKSIHALNVGAFGACMQKTIYRALEIPEKPWKEIIKKNLGDERAEPYSTLYRERMLMESRQMGFCHHCKYIFPNEFLWKCTYKSTNNKRSSCNDALKQNENFAHLYKRKESK